METTYCDHYITISEVGRSVNVKCITWGDRAMWPTFGERLRGYGRDSATNGLSGPRCQNRGPQIPTNPPSAHAKSVALCLAGVVDPRLLVWLTRNGESRRVGPCFHMSHERCLG